MKQGDFTLLAKHYHNRAAYSEHVLNAVLRYMNVLDPSKCDVADIGAGTGKLTQQLLQMGLKVTAVEPNDAMREQGEQCTKDYPALWLKGSGEETGLANSSAAWLLMASSFHWTNPTLSLPEFYRVLKPQGYLTVLWNPRALENSELHNRIEKIINKIVPNLNRISSGASEYTKDIEQTLVSTGHFKNVIFMEAHHVLEMTPDRYMGAWHSVNDIQAQAGEENWKRILQAIEKEIQGLNEILVPYKTRAWTCQRVD